MVPTQPAPVTQQTFTGNTTNLPKYAFLTSVAATLIFTVLCWLPGLLCLVPATVMSILVSSKCTFAHALTPTPLFLFPQALSKKEENKLTEAKQFSIVSFTLVLVFVISYPILVLVVLLSTVFGYWCKPVYSYSSYSYSSYSYPYGYYYSRC